MAWGVVFFFLGFAFWKKSKPSISLSDLELVQQFSLTGEEIYFTELFKRHTHLAFGVAMKYLKDPDASQDVVMVVFEKMWQQRPTQPIQNFAFWLHTVTKNQCLMLLRQQGTVVMESVPENSSDWDVENESSLHPIEKEERLEALEKALEQLPEGQQVCLRLFYWQEKSYAEIAEATGYPLAQVKSYIQNGKRNLYQIVGK